MKERVLWLYQRLTHGNRRRLLDTLRENGQVPVAILFYHRVADQCPNAWTLSRSDFCRHLDWLQDNCDVVSLAEAQRAIQSPNNERAVASITFDDGYAENADFAIPELLRRGLSATYFVSTEFVRTGASFPHDVEAGYPLPPNTIEQLREFASQGIELGAHTKTHADLGALQSESTVRDEIVGSAQQLEEWTGQPIRYFAFPFGLPANTSQLAVNIIQEAGFEGFCTAFGEWNWPHSPGYHLRRIHADPGLESLRNWLTYDPRKLKKSVPVPFVEPQPDSPVLTKVE